MNKYGVAPAASRTWNGITFRSRAEMLYATKLDLLTRIAGPHGLHQWWYEPTRYDLRAISGDVVSHYTPDFKLLWRDGTIEHHEVKGVMTDGARLSIKFFRACYPECTLKIIDAKSLKERKDGPPNKRARLKTVVGPRVNSLTASDR
jgi:hypothetical protein